MAKVDVVVLVDKKLRSSLDEVARALEGKGLTIQDKIPRFRTIIGIGDSSQIEQLKSVDGVEMVRPQHRFQLPPVDEKVPQ